MVSYGDIPINLLDDVNEAFVHFSYDCNCLSVEELSTEEMIAFLIAFGLVFLKYLRFDDGDFIYDCEDDVI